LPDVRLKDASQGRIHFSEGAPRRKLSKSSGLASAARRRRNSLAVSRLPTFSATAAARNWLREAPSSLARRAAAALTELGSFSG